MGDLQVHEVDGTIESHLGSVGKRRALPRKQIDSILLDQSALIDQFGVEFEQRLRVTGIESGVALVDVDATAGSFIAG